MLGAIVQLFSFIENLGLRHSTSQKDLLCEQAEKRYGQVIIKRGHSPKLMFDHKGFQVAISTPMTTRIMRTNATIEGDELPATNAVIRKNTSFPNLLNVFKYSEFQSKDSTFDMWYGVSGSSQCFMKKLVNTDFRGQLLTAKHRNIFRSFEIQPRRLIYENDEVPTSTEEYNALIEMALYLVDQVLRVKQEFEAV